MKKVLAEVDNQQLTPDLQARLNAIEARLEKLDPSPKLETIEPYAIGSEVFHIRDLEGLNPLRVCGYDHRTARILIRFSPDEPAPRAVSLQSVRPAPSQRLARMDPRAKEYWEGRRQAEMAAKTSPVLPPPPRSQRRYGEQDQIPTWGMRGHIEE